MEQKPTQKRRIAIWQTIPNLMTVGAICAGLTAIRLSIQGQFETAVFFVLVAAVLDGLDGTVARLLKSESEIGAELDSLADFTNFGVATGLLMYFYGLQDSHSLGWIIILIYAICCVLRLARFNVDARINSSSLGANKDFVGVPAPAGALIALMPFFFNKTFSTSPQPEPFFVGMMLIIAGYLMISRIPTPSLKSVTISRDNAQYFVIAVVILTAMLMTWTWETMALFSSIYFTLVLWKALVYIKNGTLKF